jgi:DNA-binding NarL/FixJ family response regulator
VADPLPIAIVEDHALFRSMLRTSLTGQDGIRVVMSAGSVAEARQVFQPGSAHVAILDVELPDGSGIDLGIELRRRDPQLRILLLSTQNAMDAIADLPADVAGGWSYLSTTSTANVATLARAVRSTASGVAVLDPGVVAKPVPSRSSALARLTKRQYEVLQ